MGGVRGEGRRRGWGGTGVRRPQPAGCSRGEGGGGWGGVGRSGQGGGQGGEGEASHLPEARRARFCRPCCCTRWALCCKVFWAASMVLGLLPGCPPRRSAPPPAAGPATAAAPAGSGHASRCGGVSRPATPPRRPHGPPRARHRGPPPRTQGEGKVLVRSRWTRMETGSGGGEARRTKRCGRENRCHRFPHGRKAVVAPASCSAAPPLW